MITRLWTQSDHFLLKNLYLIGTPIRDIAEQLDRSVAATEHRIAKLELREPPNHEPPLEGGLRYEDDPDAVYETDRPEKTEPVDVTANFMGDPPPERSAAQEHRSPAGVGLDDSTPAIQIVLP